MSVRTPAPDIATVAALVADATAAPSMHNAQPWRFRYRTSTRTFELRPDSERTMPHADPQDRALHLGCGAALFNLRVAIAHTGSAYECELLPNPDDRELLATVHLDASGPADAALAALHPAIRHRHTSRAPFEEKAIPEHLRTELASQAAEEGVRLAFANPWHAEHVLNLVEDAEGRDSLDPRRFEDVARWTRRGEAIASDGIPEYAFGPRKRNGGAPVRDFAGRIPVADRPAERYETTPNLALLGTARDTIADWLRAGQAMERVLLHATRNDLATSITSHALEWPDLRELVRDPASAIGHTQIVLRLGYGPRSVATPRRPVLEVLEVDEA